MAQTMGTPGQHGAENECEGAKRPGGKEVEEAKSPFLCWYSWRPCVFALNLSFAFNLRPLSG